MAFTSIALCSRALLMIGATPISSFDEETAEATVSACLYPSTRDALLASHRWNFATRQQRLPQLVQSPTADFSAAFQLPSDCLRVLSAGSGGRGRGVTHRVIGRIIESDVSPLVATYVARVSESMFAAAFCQALIARLASELCLPLTESASRATLLRKVAEEEARRARFVDAQEGAPPRLEDFPLITVRGGGI